MAEPQLISCVREKRAALDLSQSELGMLVGVSRQAIAAIESGKQVPSTDLALRLAHQLQSSVEELFQPVHPLALHCHLARKSHSPRVLLGNVDGRWVAHPVVRSDKGADGLVRKYRASSDKAVVEPLSHLRDFEGRVLLAGCAPLLGILGEGAQRASGRGGAAWIFANSSAALSLLKNQLVHVAGLHLVDMREPQGHEVFVREHFPDRAMTVINLTQFRQGLVVRSGNPRGIRCVTDALRADLTFVRREPGSGAHELFCRLLAGQGVDKGALRPGPLAGGHDEVASWVASGLADAGVAIESAALDHGLDFIPLAEERFDLVVPEERLALPEVARLLERMSARTFRAEAESMGGYDMTTTGHAVTISA